MLDRSFHHEYIKKGRKKEGEEHGFTRIYLSINNLSVQKFQGYEHEGKVR